MPKRTANYSVSPQSQLMFIGLAVLSICAQLLVLSYWALRQLPSNANFSAFLIPAAQGVGVPALFFATAYILRPADKPSRARVFEAVFYAALGVMAANTISQVSILLYQNYWILNGGYWDDVFYYLAGSALTYVIFLVFLWRYKR